MISSEGIWSVQSFLTRLKDTKEVDIGEVDSIKCMSLSRPDLQITHLLSPGKSKFCLNELSVRSVEWSELRHNRTMQGRCRIRGLDHHVIHQLFLFFLWFHVFSILCDIALHWSLSLGIRKPDVRKIISKLFMFEITKHKEYSAECSKSTTTPWYVFLDWDI